ncbi:hypothetical protein [Alkalisalibacterium limincola]|uniref:hypothetical protein n=1 Tax=Alkalisalibacterium limincola TaxID=2699169 RepID=UPI002103F446|nr:hypothetical protein [Alkalisalibacterium limincola]
MGVDAAVLQHQLDLRAFPVDTGDVAAVEGALQAREFRRGLGEVGIHGIELLDARQRRRVALADQRTLGDQGPADPAAIGAFTSA